jgi:hypothetical protein
MRGGALECLCLSVLALACGRTALIVGDGSDSEVGGGETNVTTGGQGGASDAVTGPSSGAGGQGGTVASGGSGGVPESVIGYVQSRTHLYALFGDLEPVLIGPLDGCVGDALDIAVDEVGTLFVSAPAGLYRVDPANASCSLISHGSYPNGLTVISPGNPHPLELVGVNTTTYERIDKLSGATSTLGTLGTTEFYSSGDLALHNARMYLAISGGSCFDCLAEIDRQTGALVKNIGPIGFAKVFGLMSYDGFLFGFTNAGQILTIDVTTGAGTLVNEFPIEFWGAARHP